ncbi:NAD(P)-dependent dehydrogenase, short-chain alcohol dehydrogenase family [Tistlia consotensis]|uniref:NAD(P)-dependent dehydrogenase, short-chain alcohol dehydrogenase family n=1 Tax=Tistlia consotensis USBA 355 TaxID=560819 RepID=A0A1Y6BFA4_9PROT|nr:SDR family oxidoreductase [Tistlia consotensis]SME98424.1 NAD(P)-dependent dehydrogenase, short-chain alcohol dehydrogenase family [Tistlia consotensis USBA 355]SNR57805.1 NAD(P)-dependent dehydrogenase, short-chain alcohol dehydrogenase family [Tistlia consotensis]
MSGLFDLDGRVVVVTGGLGQLGRQFCQALLGQGARVAVLDRGRGLELDAELVRKRFGAAADDPNLLFVGGDITDRASLEAARQHIRSRWEEPSGLVNNAALDSPPDSPAEETGPFETYPESSWDKVMEVNAKGPFLCCQVFGGGMAEAGGGSIVNVASIYGLVSPDQGLYEYRRQRGETFFKPVAYSASKSSLYNLTRYLATYWGPRGVRVNTVTFAGVFNNQDPAFLEKYCAKVPLGRMADEAEYNGTIIYLMSKASAYMTGANLTIDGGFTAW